MQTLTEKVYKLAPPGGLFDETVVRNLFPDLSAGGRKAIVHRAVRKGEVLRLKPGLYCLGEEYRKSHPHPFVVAGMIHGPSHISLESALSYYGLIPEAVYQVTSVTERRSRSFKTHFAHFSFERVPANYPRAGVSVVRMSEDGWAFLASPLRALADLIYLRKSVQWERDRLEFLTESMRIEGDDLKEISMRDFDEIIESSRNRRTREYLKGLWKELRR
ncbi:hypothetical protein ACFLU6_09755 [Acidobacteriota bacterium]